MGASTQAVAGAGVEAEDIVSARPPRTVLLVLAFCFCYIAGALALWPATFLEMAQTYFLVLALYGWMIALAIVLPLGVIAAPKQPVRAMIDIIRRRGMLAVFVVATFALGLAAFTTYKLNIPTFVPFYGDKAMADIDDFLHGGPPWKIAHSVDSEMTSWIVSRTYYGTWFFEWFGMAFLAAFHARQPLHQRYLVALALTTAVIGTFLATLFSSVGPIFYDQLLNETRYADLYEALRHYPYNEHIVRHSEYLLQNYRAGSSELGTGISAMPSMHVAIATLNAFYLARLNRWCGVVGWVFAVLILFGSVYTGWHYALDGYVSVAVVSLIWWLSASISEYKSLASSKGGSVTPAWTAAS